MSIEYIKNRIEKYRAMNESGLVSLWETCLRLESIEISIDLEGWD
jgi:hypothetical protein